MIEIEIEMFEGVETGDNTNHEIQKQDIVIVDPVRGNRLSICHHKVRRYFKHQPSRMM